MANYLPIVSLFSFLFINTEVICSDFPAGFLGKFNLNYGLRLFEIIVNITLFVAYSY